jgi:hypothetical protein
MKKRFKMLIRGCNIHLLKWVSDGKLFGPDWEYFATFGNTPENLRRCKGIIRNMNECDTHSNHHEDDRD